MINIPILYFGYLIILFSIIGFGYLSSKLLSVRLSLGELGLKWNSIYDNSIIYNKFICIT